TREPSVCQCNCTSIIVRKFESVRWIHRKPKIHALENMIEEKSYIATWCQVCDKQVNIEERDTYRLLTHIRKYYPKNGDLRISSNRISSPVTPVDRSGKKNESKKVYATRGRYRCD
ncbi:hypothetical protein ALC60_02990, partial [Trachymyrmex zeteki]